MTNSPPVRPKKFVTGRPSSPCDSAMPVPGQPSAPSLSTRRPTPHGGNKRLDTILFEPAPDLAQALHGLLADPAVRGGAARGLAAFDHAATPGELLKHYASFNDGEKADAVLTLASRPAYALALLDAVEKGTVPRRDMSAYTARQMQALKSKEVSDRLAKVWGAVRTTSRERTAQTAKYKALLTPDFVQAADLSRGRQALRANLRVVPQALRRGRDGRSGADRVAASEPRLHPGKRRRPQCRRADGVSRHGAGAENRPAGVRDHRGRDAAGGDGADADGAGRGAGRGDRAAGAVAGVDDAGRDLRQVVVEKRCAGPAVAYLAESRHEGTRSLSRQAATATAPGFARTPLPSRLRRAYRPGRRGPSPPAPAAAPRRPGACPRRWSSRRRPPPGRTATARFSRCSAPPAGRRRRGSGRRGGTRAGSAASTCRCGRPAARGPSRSRTPRAATSRPARRASSGQMSLPSIGVLRQLAPPISFASVGSRSIVIGRLAADRAGGDLARPAHDARHADAALERRALALAQRPGRAGVVAVAQPRAVVAR